MILDIASGVNEHFRVVAVVLPTPDLWCAEFCAEITGVCGDFGAGAALKC